jgi:hypothetical protein
MKRSGRILPAPAIWRGQFYCRRRVLSRVHKPGPWTLLSCLGPGVLRRTVSMYVACSCSCVHRVYISDSFPLGANSLIASRHFNTMGGYPRLSSFSGDSARNTRTFSTSSAPWARSARAKARLREALSKHSRFRCRYAPRPDDDPVGSGTALAPSRTIRTKPVLIVA